ncbi:hypothetical protein LJ737_05190 [Hymenobacter sp. 15J16-1T3B]|uniref:hypothetical protein n=1 Tax=Hymenobacter sp. 15J16-1T3B TaxID=2886941 RepID=UPI001D10740F|nr:hypothetical protein [Hymenobacter sp. 15J16-1T3B]MCC3156621.1 hypothetical protein [Hymenobacter sp. 15J16-1T3B]
MKLCLRFLLFLGGWLLAAPAAWASHALGGQITYQYVGTPAQPNLYRVTCRMFRDCSGIAASTSLTLNCRVGTPTTSCNSNDPRNFSTTLTAGLVTIGAPYCASAGNACSAGGRPNYETTKYEAVVTLPPAAWTLSVSENARPALANITGTSQDLYLEATLNNQITLASGATQTVNNTSPQYLDQNVPIPFVCTQQRTTLSFATFEPDGDSLVYSLDRALEGCNQPMTYKTFVNGAVDIFPTNPPCVLMLAAGTGTAYSPTFPIPSFDITGSCPVKIAVPSFRFTPATGSVTFTPYYYDPANAASNKYSVVGKVTEYRRLNGRYYQVGSVRRDMIVIVTDCGNNQVPNLPSIAGAPTDTIVVQGPVMAYTTASFTLSDPNPSDQLTVTFGLPADQDYLSLYVDPTAPNVPISVTGNGTAAPVLQVRLRPESTLLGRTFRIPVRVEDNACPLRGVQNFVVVLRTVAARPLAVAGGRPRATLSAFPNPFTEQVSFTVPRPRGTQVVLIHDQLGREVARLPVPAGTGTEATLTWMPAAALPAGVYTARAAEGGPAVRLLRR